LQCSWGAKTSSAPEGCPVVSRVNSNDCTQALCVTSCSYRKSRERQKKNLYTKCVPRSRERAASNCKAFVSASLESNACRRERWIENHLFRIPRKFGRERSVDLLRLAGSLGGRGAQRPEPRGQQLPGNNSNEQVYAGLSE